MARTGFFHHIGTFLLFAGAVLLLITTISAPVVNNISILKVHLSDRSTAGYSSVTFGTFGYCMRDATDPNDGKDACTGKHIGYNPAVVMERIDNTDFNRASVDTTKALTRVMILHPIVTGLAFISFLLSVGSGVCGALFAALFAALTWALTVVVMATDFVLFGIIKNHINGDKDNSGSKAEYSVAMWTLLVGMIALFFGTFMVLFTCFSARRHRNDVRTTKTEYVAPATTRRRFWQRRTRY